MAVTIGFKGAELNLLVRQGATFGPMACTLTNPDTSPVSLAGATIRGQVRRLPNSATVAAPFTCTITNSAAGQFSYSITATDTASLSAGLTETDADSQYYWDMEMEIAGVVTPLMYGAVSVFREVTKT